MKKVVVTGSECTGKTTLARTLAEHYGTIWVPEYLRDFAARKAAPLTYADAGAIARGQIDREDDLAAKATGFLILDTDLLSCVVYNRHYYGRCPSWIEDALDERAGDLYLLAGLDVPWVGDGQRDRGDRREEMQALFRQELVDRGLRFVEIPGDPDTRARQAVTAINAPGESR